MENVISPDPYAGAVANSGRPALAETYAVAGRFVCVWTDEPEAAELFRRFFAGWHFARLEGADAPQPDANIRVNPGAPPPPPDGLESFETAGGGFCCTDGRTYIFERDGSAVRAVGDGRGVEVWIGEGADSRERSALARLVFEATMVALRRCGLFELHAAGVVEPETGGGFLVVGPSGSGKSTLATQLASAGWRYLSDDALLLRAVARDWSRRAPCAASSPSRSRRSPPASSKALKIYSMSPCRSTRSSAASSRTRSSPKASPNPASPARSSSPSSRTSPRAARAGSRRPRRCAGSCGCAPGPVMTGRRPRRTWVCSRGSRARPRGSSCTRGATCSATRSTRLDTCAGSCGGGSV